MSSKFTRTLQFVLVVLILPACGKSGNDSLLPLPGAWARTYGSAVGDLSAGFGHVVPLASSYAVAGEYKNSQAWVLLLNLDGSIQWQNAYGASGTRFNSLAPAPNGGVIAVGSTTTMGAGGADVWVVLLNSDGSIAWQKTYGGPGNDYGWRVRATSDGGFIVLAGSNTFTGTVANLWILKLNSDGTVAWQKTYITSTSLDSADISEVPAGGYIVGASTSFGSNFEDAWVVRLNSDGTVAWQYRYGTTAYELANTAVPTLDGGFLVVGAVGPSSGPGSTNAWIFKLDSTGAVLWQNLYSATSYDNLSSCTGLTDGTFLLTGETGAPMGSTGSKLWSMHLNSDGSIDWQKEYGGAAGQDGTSLQPSPFGGLILQGNTSSYGAGSYDWWVLHLNEDGTCPPLDTNTSATIAPTAASRVATTFVAADTAITPAATSVTPAATFGITVSQAP